MDGKGEFTGDFPQDCLHAEQMLHTDRSTDMVERRLLLAGRAVTRAGVRVLQTLARGTRRALRPVRLTCFIAVVSAGLILLRNLMTPPLVSGDLTSRYAQFDLLLSNGRAPLTLQFPMIVLWLVSLLMLLLFDVLSVALTLQRALPGLNGKVCVFAAPLSCMALALFGVGARTDAMALARWLYTAQGTLLAALMLQNGKKRGLLRA